MREGSGRRLTEMAQTAVVEQGAAGAGRGKGPAGPSR